MLTPALLGFVRSSLPPPPARVLEIGAGTGELAAALAEAGYEVTPIDPAAEPGSHVRSETLLETRGSFDAAVAVVSLHHVDPLEESCAHLASMLEVGAPLVIDEIDRDRCDERATRWWLGQRHALGAEEDHHDPSEVLEHLRTHVHPLARVYAALRPYFHLGEPVRGPYLHRWDLPAGLEAIEVGLISEGMLPAVGVRQVAIRTASARPAD